MKGSRKNLTWRASGTRDFAKKYTCGHCQTVVAGKQYFEIDATTRDETDDLIVICPNCNRPTYFFQDKQIPGVGRGQAKIKYVPPDIHEIYSQVRLSYASASWASVALLCRKILMNVAVHLGANEGKSFLEYVSFLSDKNFISPQNHKWLDAIRKLGNDENHKIKLSSENEAKKVLDFSEIGSFL